jgi:N-acyl-D-amino-acid deacylase
VFNLKDRGMLQEGKKADLVIFDPKTIIDQATFVEPRQYPKGIEMVMINGTVVVEQGKRAQAITGKVIRN